MWIETWTGKKFFPLCAKPEDICVEDIAQALSNQCRYNGHCEFYSVAEHSVKLSRFFRVQARLSAIALLHDAAEAYLGDIPKPIRSYFLDYTTIEDRLLREIFQVFRVKWPNKSEWEAIKSADERILRDEKKSLFPNSANTWPIDNEPLLKISISCWSPHKAKTEFLREFNKRVKGKSR